MWWCDFLMLVIVVGFIMVLVGFVSLVVIVF